MKHNSPSSKIVLAASGAAFLLMNTPAWGQGFAACAVICCLLWLWIWKAPLPDMYTAAFRDQHYLVWGAVLCTTFAFNFYANWISSQVISKICRFLPVKKSTFLFAAAGVLALLSAPIAGYLVRACEDAARRLFSGKTEKGKFNAVAAFGILLLIFVIGISALLRANVFYQDDGCRAVWGYKQWDYFGRYLSTGLATWVHSGHFLADAAPLPQLLACAVLALSGVIALSVLTGRNTFSLWEIAAVVPIGLNPYFLECYSFRFDAPYMALSVLLGIWPLLYRSGNPHRYIAVSALGCLGVCCTYQAGTGIFPMLVLLCALRMWQEQASASDTFRFLCRSVLGYGLGLVIFKFMLMRPADAGYVSNSMFPMAQLFRGTFRNLAIYWRAVRNDFRPLWRILCVGVVLGFLWKTGRSKWAAGIAGLAAVLCMALLAFGLYPLLENTLFAARAMYGVGVGLSFIAVCSAEGSEGYPCKMAVLLLSGCFLVFALVYGNAIQNQKTYSDFRMESVLADVAQIQPLEENAAIRVNGSVPVCQMVENEIAVYPVLKRLVTYGFDGSEFFMDRLIATYNLKLNRDDSIPPSNLPLVKDTMYHRIYADSSHIFVELK